jgi:hypothetical protein
MNISLDYDDTYTRDPKMWNTVVTQMKLSGHNVYLVTMRTPEQGLEVLSTIGRLIGAENCFFTSMQGKRNYMWKKGIKIDVWIDDMPDAILRGIDDTVNDGKIYL